VAELTDVVHLLRRAEFVARPERVAALTAAGVDYAAAVADVLDVAAGDVPIPDEIATHRDEETWEQYQFAVHWWIERMARDSPRPVQEKMALFWHGHFCSEWSKVFDTGAMLAQNALFRAEALGNVRRLAQAMAVQPAMLRYLDNDRNTQRSPNQNFARELLELFLLGVGNYTEADVEAATRAWTGHNLDSAGQYVFVASQHDAGDKTFLGRTGAWDGPDIIDIVLGPDAVVAVGPNAGVPTRVVAARFLSTKLWRAFASEHPSPAVVHALADVLVANDFEVRPWLATLLKHPEFRSPASRTGLVRTPTELIVHLLYHSGIRASDAHPEWYAEGMGQALFHPPNVSGWKINGYWVNTAALASRAAFADRIRWLLLAGRSTGGPLALRAGTWTYADLDGRTGASLVDLFASAFDLPISTSTRDALIAWTAGEVRTWGIDWWRTPNALLLTMVAPEVGVA
jgi:uncharacterized protein (DUF1800 family)